MSDQTQTAEATMATAEPETAQPESPQVEQTAEVPSPEAPVVGNMVPRESVIKERHQRQELQRKLAEYEQKSKLSQYTEDDMGQVMNHPFVQELLIKQAKYELTDFAKGELDEHPEIPEPVKKAILANVRGFVKETTTDVESAKLDIQEYIGSLIEQLPQPVPKAFPVANTKAQEAVGGANPMDIQQILEKPIDEWSPDEAKLVKTYKKSLPKR